MQGRAGRRKGFKYFTPTPPNYTNSIIDHASPGIGALFVGELRQRHLGLGFACVLSN